MKTYKTIFLILSINVFSYALWAQEKGKSSGEGFFIDLISYNNHYINQLGTHAYGFFKKPVLGPSRFAFGWHFNPKFSLAYEFTSVRRYYAERGFFGSSHHQNFSFLGRYNYIHLSDELKKMGIKNTAWADKWKKWATRNLHWNTPWNPSWKMELQPYVQLGLGMSFYRGDVKPSFAIGTGFHFWAYEQSFSIRKIKKKLKLDFLNVKDVIASVGLHFQLTYKPIDTHPMNYTFGISVGAFKYNKAKPKQKPEEETTQENQQKPEEEITQENQQKPQEEITQENEPIPIIDEVKEQKELDETAKKMKEIFLKETADAKEEDVEKDISEKETNTKRKEISDLAKSVAFKLGSAILTKAATAALYKVAMQVRGTNLKVLIEGHTDNVGGDFKNMILSLKRAKAVQEFLKKMGLKNKVIYVGYGAQYPLKSNATKEGRSINRRVEIKVSKNLEEIRKKKE